MPRRSLSLVRTGRPHISPPLRTSRTGSERDDGRAADPMSRIGNRATGRLIGARPGPLRVGGVSDRFEAEAKAFSGRAPVPGRLPHAPGLRGVGADGSGRVSDDIADRIRGMRGGQPLPQSVKGPLEAQHRTGLGGIRIHTGPEAEALTSAVGARAMTLDNNIFYGRGSSPRDMSLTSEEVAHTMQQGAVPSTKPMGRAPKGVIQRDVPWSYAHKTTKKFAKGYKGKFDDVDMGAIKIMTPTSKKTLGTYGLFTCGGLAVAAKTSAGWYAGLHHMPGGSGDLVQAYNDIRGALDTAKGTGETFTEEARYLVPGTAFSEEKGEHFEQQVGAFDNDWRALAASYAGKGASAAAVVFERSWKLKGPSGLKAKFFTYG